jgi:hypothetical protein
MISLSLSPKDRKLLFSRVVTCCSYLWNNLNTPLPSVVLESMINFIISLDRIANQYLFPFYKHLPSVRGYSYPLQFTQPSVAYQATHLEVTSFPKISPSPQLLSTLLYNVRRYSYARPRRYQVKWV